MYFLLITLGVFFGYKIRKAIEVLNMTKDIKYVKIIVDRVLTQKMNVLENVTNTDKDDFKEYLKMKSGAAE